MSYQSMEEAQLRCKKDGIPFWKAVQIEDANERGVTLENSWKQMTGMWQSMKRIWFHKVEWSEKMAVRWMPTERMRNRYVAILWQKLWQMH